MIIPRYIASILKIKTRVRDILNESLLGRIILIIYKLLISYPIILIKASVFYFKINDVNFRVKFLTNEKLFESITTGGCSFIRFGDGEISWMFGKGGLHFGQENSDGLMKDLRVSFSNKSQKIIIGIPNFFTSENNISLKRKVLKNAHLYSNYHFWKLIIDPNYHYGDALVTRPYNGISSSEQADLLFGYWRKVFDKKNILLVEGEFTRFGVGNNLLDSCSSVKRIIAPALGAYSLIETIHKKISLRYDKDVLILLALGPTASILGSWVTNDGYQAIDVGHLDIEYHWYLSQASTKRPISGKYVNESGGFSKTQLPNDLYDKYKLEIVESVL